MKLKESFHPYAFATIFCWSLSYVLTRLALQHFTPIAIGVFRCLIASAVMLAVAVITKMRPPAWRDVPWFLLSGACGFFLYLYTFNTGSQTVTASTSSVVIATAPIMTALFARIFYRERLGLLQYAAILLSFAGVVTLTALCGGFSANIGLVYLLAAAVMLSSYNLLQRRLTRRYAPLTVTAYSIFAGTLMLCVFLPQSAGQLKNAPAVPLVCVLVMGVFSSALAYCAWAKAFSLAKNTSSVSNYMFVTPFLSTLFGMLLAGETVDNATLIGGVLIVGGLLLFNLSKQKKGSTLKIGVRKKEGSITLQIL